jgi:excisionase family DNA binding protein
VENGEERTLTIQDVMELLRVSYPTVWRIKGELGGYQVKTLWRFHKSGVDNYIQRQKEKAREYCMQKQENEQMRKRRGRKAVIKSESFQEETNAELALLYNLHS